MCVNALNGLFLFLLKIAKELDFKTLCVNALNGLFLFLHYEEFEETEECQRPKRAFLISTLNMRKS